MIDTVRELDDTEIENVSGGTCGSGASCITTTVTETGGVHFGRKYNCSGLLVGECWWAP